MEYIFFCCSANYGPGSPALVLTKSNIVLLSFVIDRPVDFFVDISTYQSPTCWQLRGPYVTWNRYFRPRQHLLWSFPHITEAAVQSKPEKEVSVSGSLGAISWLVKLWMNYEDTRFILLFRDWSLIFHTLLIVLIVYVTWTLLNLLISDALIYERWRKLRGADVTDVHSFEITSFCTVDINFVHL